MTLGRRILLAVGYVCVATLVAAVMFFATGGDHPFYHYLMLASAAVVGLAVGAALRRRLKRTKQGT